jgi:hypothetical protein
VSRRVFRNGWVFSPGVDLLAFAGPVVLAAGVVWGFARAGRLDEEVPPWLFALLVVGCDVAHVWGTLFRAYLDPRERARRGGLLLAVPLAALAVGTTLHAADAALFWRLLAYAAAFHFVRQQWGWMAYAGRRAGAVAPIDRALDRLAVYASTVFPLLWWHANLPRAFAWFVDGDFVTGVPGWAGTVGQAVHFGALGAWGLRQVVRVARGEGTNLAQWLVLGTTWVTWYGGIVLLDSDVAFTASNVLAHGVPYAVLVHRWGAARWRGEGGALPALFRPSGVPAFVLVLVALAWVEEAVWDGFVWHRHGSLFPLPDVTVPEDVLSLLVPLLAVPQATHYVLDAFLWRTGAANPDLAATLGLGPPREPEAAAAGPAPTS